MGQAGIRAIAVAVWALVALVAVVAAGLPLYVFPADDHVDRADVIVVLGPATPARVAVAQRLLDEGVAPRMLISVPPEGTYAAANIPACREAHVNCVSPRPATTKGEALMLDEDGARSAVVVTFSPQVARARFIFDKCHHGPVSVVGADDRLSLVQWAYQYAYQSAAFAKAWVLPCAGATR